MRSLFAIALVICGGAACYAPALGRCSIGCEDGVCPPGGTCGTDGFCHFETAVDECGPPPVMHELTIIVEGEGSVTGVGGLACNDQCTVMLPEGDYELTAVPTETSRLGMWQINDQLVDCGTAEICSLTLDTTTSVRARFEPAVIVTLVFTGDGRGRVVSTPPGLDCIETTSPCIGRFAPDELVTLTMTSSGPSVFNGWAGGDCQGTAPCQLPPLDAMAPPDVFADLNVTRLTLFAVPAGVGTINLDNEMPCPDVCEIEVAPGSAVAFEAVLPRGSDFTFDHWVNVCGDDSDPSCMETVDTDKVVIALFEPKPSVTVNVGSNAAVEIRIAGMLVRTCGGAQQPVGVCREFVDPGASVELKAISTLMFKSWNLCPTAAQEQGPVFCGFAMGDVSVVVNPTFDPVSN